MMKKTALIALIITFFLSNNILYTKPDERIPYLRGAGLIFCAFGGYQIVNSNNSIFKFLVGLGLSGVGVELIINPEGVIEEYDKLAKEIQKAREESKKIRVQRKLRMYWDKVDDTLELSEKKAAISRWFNKHF